MASRGLQSRRFVQLINQQLEILKEERTTVIGVVDACINQVQSEVDAWFNGGLVNRTTYCEMNNRIHELIQLFIEKSVELSGQQIEEQKCDLNQHSLTTINNSTSSGISCTKDEDEGSNTSHILITRFTVLEEAVCSLKRTIEQVQEKQDNFDEIVVEFSSKHEADDRLLKDLAAKHEIVDRTLKDFSSKNKKFDGLFKNITTRQEHVCENIDMLTNKNLNSRKKLQNRLSKLEKGSQDIFSNFDNLFETVTNFDDKLNRLEEKNKSVNVAMNELNKQISSVRTCSNDALMSIQDLSKSVESTNQHFSEMSNKMNQLEISINLFSSQYTEQFENMSSRHKDTYDDLIGMFCQLLASRLTPLEKLHETLNKRVNAINKPLSREGAIEKRLSGMSKQITQIELKRSQEKVVFYACKSLKVTREWCDVKTFEFVEFNYGDHFDHLLGKFTAPLTGLYLISISTDNAGNNENIVTRCYQRSYNPLNRNYYPINLCNVSGNKSTTRCTEMTAGEVLYLQSKTFFANANKCISIYFSCCLTKR